MIFKQLAQQMPSAASFEELSVRKRVSGILLPCRLLRKIAKNGVRRELFLTLLMVRAVPFALLKNEA